MPTRIGALTCLAAVAVTAGLLATGCSSNGSPSAASQPGATSQEGNAHGTRAAPARLTINRARIRYRRISAPFNASVAAVNQDAHEGTTWARFRTDVLAAISANKKWKRKISVVRWPPRIERYVRAMLRTEVPAEIRCDRAMAAAGSLQGAADAFSNDHACRDSTANADKIRKILHLPPAIG